MFSFREKARGSLQISLVPVSAKEFEEDARVIYGVGIKLKDFMLTRGLGPHSRLKPAYERADRSKKAREERRKAFFKNPQNLDVEARPTAESEPHT